MESLEDTGPLPLNLIEERSKIREQLLCLAAKEESFQPQKFKVKWLGEGDENTRFYHRVLCLQEKVILSREGQSLLTDNDIGAEFIDFYQKLYIKEWIRGLFQKISIGTKFPSISTMNWRKILLK